MEQRDSFITLMQASREAGVAHATLMRRVREAGLRPLIDPRDHRKRLLTRAELDALLEVKERREAKVAA